VSGFNKTARQIKAIALLSGKALYILLFGGARSGKTAILVYALVVRALKCKSRHLILRRHFNHVKTTIGYDTMPKVLELIAPGLGVKLNKADWFWKFPNGSEIWIAGLDDKERTDKVLGSEFSTILFEEASEMSWESVETALTRLAENTELTNKAYFSCNPPAKKHWLFLLFIEKLNPESRAALPHPELYEAMLMNPYDNEENLPEGYISDILGNLSDRKRKRFLEGLWGEDEEGALWNSGLIAPYRVKEAPELVRVVVGCDPTGSTTGDEAGVIAAGRGEDGQYYVLDDQSMHGSPLQWGRATIGCYKANEGDRVIGETNFGGDMVESNLRTIDPNVSYKGVHASRSKIVRAEPIAAAYERGLVHHVGEFPDLEDEMCSYTPDSKKSPNRLDALVFALTELGLTGESLQVYALGQSQEQDLPETAEQAQRQAIENEAAWEHL